jgi:hypothetical protein
MKSEEAKRPKRPLGSETFITAGSAFQDRVNRTWLCRNSFTKADDYKTVIPLIIHGFCQDSNVATIVESNVTQYSHLQQR